MRLTRSVVAVALVLAAASSQADTFLGPLNLSAGGAHFGRDAAVGSFEDTYTFTLGIPGNLIAAAAGTASPDALNDLDMNNPRITDAAGLTLATFLGNRGTDANESYWLDSFFLPAGDYKLIVSGFNSVDQASYSGNLSISAVPEPESYAMFMAGLAALAVVVGRRRRDRDTK